MIFFFSFCQSVFFDFCKEYVVKLVNNLAMNIITVWSYKLNSDYSNDCLFTGVLSGVSIYGCLQGLLQGKVFGLVNHFVAIQKLIALGFRGTIVH